MSKLFVVQEGQQTFEFETLESMIPFHTRQQDLFIKFDAEHSPFYRSWQRGFAHVLGVDLAGVDVVFEPANQRAYSKVVFVEVKDYRDLLPADLVDQKLRKKRDHQVGSKQLTIKLPEKYFWTYVLLATLDETAATETWHQLRADLMTLTPEYWLLVSLPQSGGAQQQLLNQALEVLRNQVSRRLRELGLTVNFRYILYNTKQLNAEVSINYVP